VIALAADGHAGWYRLQWGRGASREKFVEVQTGEELQAEVRKVGGGTRTVLTTRVRVHTCSACGKQGPWTASWGWYGSYADLDADRPVVKLCSDPCWTAAKAQGLIPRNASKKAVGEEEA
jgi:hypothetical protein